MPKLWIQKCPVCGKDVTEVTWHADEEFDENHPLREKRDAVTCDFADREGCFMQYHDECFDQHSCPAFDKIRASQV